MTVFSFFATDASAGSWALFVLVTSFAGVCMGIVGVGGVVIVPAAIALLREDPKVAVASTIPGYIITAGAGTWSYRKVIARDHAILRFACLAAAGAGAGGFLAAFALYSIPSDGIAVAVAIFALMFGLKSLFGVACSRGTCEERKAAIPNVANRATKSIETEPSKRLTEVEMESFSPSSSYAELSLAGGSLSPLSELQDQECEQVRRGVPHVGKSGDTNPDIKATNRVAETAGFASSTEDGSISKDIEMALPSSKPIWLSDNLRSITLGIVVGFGSALTGTSGPLLFIPLAMLVIGSEVRKESRDELPDDSERMSALSPKVAVATSMAIGVPMALSMTIGNVLVLLLYGDRNDDDDGDSRALVDLGLSLVVGLTTGITVPLGATISKRYCVEEQEPMDTFPTGDEVSKIAISTERVVRENRGKNQSATLLVAISLVLVATGIYILVMQYTA